MQSRIKPKMGGLPDREKRNAVQTPAFSVLYIDPDGIRTNDGTMTRRSAHKKDMPSQNKALENCQLRMQV